MSPNHDPTSNNPRLEGLAEKLTSHFTRHQTFGRRVDITTKEIGIPVVDSNIYSPDSMSDEQQSNS